MSQSAKNSLKKSVVICHGQEKQESDNPRQGIRLADFIHQNMKLIASEWEIFARTLTPAANDMTPLALRDHIYEILAFIVSDIESSQTRLEQIEKSKGEKEPSPIA